MTNAPQSYHVTVVTALLREAERVHLAAASAYAAAVEQEAASKAAAARDKTGLPDGYWKPAHVARLRYEAAAGVYAAVIEAIEAAP